MTRNITPASTTTAYRRHRTAAHTLSIHKNKNNSNKTNKIPLEEIHHNSSASIGSTSGEESDLESPTKRYKGMVMQTPYTQQQQQLHNHYMTPRRSFGEELDANGSANSVASGASATNRVIIDTSLLRLSSTTNSDSHQANSAVSSLNADESIASDSHTDVSSVAHLRGWLDDFGKQQKKHYEAVNAKVGKAPEDAQRPTRPKVGGTSKSAAAHKPTPLPPPAASALAKRLVDTGLPRSTPIRIQTKQPQTDVRATNEGYKSVKELSAWLADDPTKTRKTTKVLRRGANVIAKSRAFDKGLKDVIIEQDLASNGCSSISGLVATKKHLLAPTLSAESSSTILGGGAAAAAAAAGGGGGGAGEQDAILEAHQEWPEETASAISVSNKKQWLANAFRREGGGGGGGGCPKAQTEVITAQDEREAVSNRAKHLWRQRSAKNKATHASNTTTNNKTATTTSATTTAASTNHNVHNTSTALTKQVVAKSMETTTNTTTTMTTTTTTTNGMSVEHNNPPKTEAETPPEQPEESTTPEKYGFSAARNFLVQKSRKNGNPVDVAKVSTRTAKYERLEKEARRKSQPAGATKASWVEAETTPTSGRSSFVRTMVSNTAPKKSIDELP